MGDGLNKPAEISLFKIYKRDAEGKAYKEGEELSKFVQRLQKTASRQGTEHVDYDADKGIWRFRVEHFSRYRFLLGTIVPLQCLGNFFSACRFPCTPFSVQLMLQKCSKRLYCTT